MKESSHPVARTALLMAALVALLGIGGWAFGGRDGFLLFAGIGLVMNFFSFRFSDRIALRTNRAQPVSRDQAPELYDIVGRLSREAGIPEPPIYVIPSDSPNAFATGRGPKHSAVAVTTGLLQQLDARQIEGVLAHELAHVRNRDVLVATIAAGLAGVVSSLGFMMQWGAMLGGDRQRRGSPLARRPTSGGDRRTSRRGGRRGPCARRRPFRDRGSRPCSFEWTSPLRRPASLPPLRSYLRVSGYG